MVGIKRKFRDNGNNLITATRPIFEKEKKPKPGANPAINVPNRENAPMPYVSGALFRHAVRAIRSLEFMLGVPRASVRYAL